MRVQCPACDYVFDGGDNHDEVGSYCPECGHGFLGCRY